MSPTTELLEERLRRDLAEIAGATRLVPPAEPPLSPTSYGVSLGHHRRWLRLGVGIAAAVVVVAAGVLALVRETTDTSTPPAGPVLENITPGIDWVWPSDDEEGIDRSTPEAVVREFARVVLGERDVDVVVGADQSADTPDSMGTNVDLTLDNGTTARAVTGRNMQGWAIGSVQTRLDGAGSYEPPPGTAATLVAYRRVGGVERERHGPVVPQLTGELWSGLGVHLDDDGRAVGVDGFVDETVLGLSPMVGNRGSTLGQFVDDAGDTVRFSSTGLAVCLTRTSNVGTRSTGTIYSTSCEDAFSQRPVFVDPEPGRGATSYAFLPTSRLSSAQAEAITEVWYETEVLTRRTAEIVARDDRVGIVVAYPSDLHGFMLWPVDDTGMGTLGFEVS